VAAAYNKSFSAAEIGTDAVFKVAAVDVYEVDYESRVPSDKGWDFDSRIPFKELEVCFRKGSFQVL
jgi:hypothetical protein